jgi:glucose-1-phosphate thymidylyltransferase
MKGVILAGGLGSRLFPLTYATNKHLLPVYDQPMVYYPIQTLVKAGITEIMVVTGGPHAGDFINVLKNGDKFGVKHLEYAFQEGEGGIPVALSVTESFADGEPVCVILGDNCTDADITDHVKNFKDGAMIFLKEVPDPERFGCPRMDDKGNILEIIEKPKDPPSDYAITGLYFFENNVYDRIRKLKPSDRGELEITDINNSYLKEKRLKWSLLKGYWRDAGTFQTLFEAAKYWADKKK